MVEAMANAVEDKLIDGLSFPMNPGASYVIDRRSVAYRPQGSNIYQPQQGTKLVRILLTGDNWLDPTTLRVSFAVYNSHVTAELKILSGPWAFSEEREFKQRGSWSRTSTSITEFTK